MEPSGLHALRNGTESRENKKESLQHTGRSTGEESCTERDPDAPQRHPEFSAEFQSAHACEEQPEVEEGSFQNG